jgi:hypothetical protein
MNIKGLMVAVAMLGTAGLTAGSALASPLDGAKDMADQVAADATPEATTNWFSWRIGFFAPRVAVAKPVVHTYWTTRYVSYAPPAPRYERIPVAPSSRHFWVNGHYNWNGRQYQWVGGHYDTVRGGYKYISGHWDRSVSGWHYVPGYWKRA